MISSVLRFLKKTYSLTRSVKWMHFLYLQWLISVCNLMCIFNIQSFFFFLIFPFSLFLYIYYNHLKLFNHFVLVIKAIEFFVWAKEIAIGIIWFLCVCVVKKAYFWGNWLMKRRRIHIFYCVVKFYFIWKFFAVFLFILLLQS